MKITREQAESRDWLNDNIKSLQDLQDLINTRSRLAIDKKLSAKILFGRHLVLDEYGNTYRITEFNLDTSKYEYGSKDPCSVYIGSFNYDWGFNVYDNIGKKLLTKISYTLSNVEIPVDKKCIHCGCQFDKSDFYDAKIINHTPINYDGEFIHSACHDLKIDDEYRKSIKALLEDIYGKEGTSFTMIPVPNKYGSRTYRGLWYLVTTIHGKFRIGWRKRVIEIVWYDDYKTFSDNFESENVTKTFNSSKRLIHADSEEIAKAYLNRAINSIL